MNKRFIAGVALGCGIAGFSHEAKAEGTIGLDAHAAALFFRTGTEASLGGALYGGYALRVSKLYVEPELALSVDGLPKASLLNVRATGGVRLGLGFVVEPSLYAHVGGAFFKGLGTSFLTSVQGTFTLDAGLGIDYRPVKFFTIGLTAGYEGFFGSRALGTVHGINVAPRIGFWF